MIKAGVIKIIEIVMNITVSIPIWSCEMSTIKAIK